MIYNQIVTWTAFAILAMFDMDAKITFNHLLFDIDHEVTTLKLVDLIIINVIMYANVINSYVIKVNKAIINIILITTTITLPSTQCTFSSSLFKVKGRSLKSIIFSNTTLKKNLLTKIYKSNGITLLAAAFSDMALLLNTRTAMTDQIVCE